VTAVNELGLQGTWEFALDPKNCGVESSWYDRGYPFMDTANLPGSTDENGYGDLQEQMDPFRLNRKRKYIGPAWYRKIVEIPKEWQDKRIVLFLERCLWESRVWVDGEYAGREDSISAPHRHDLSQLLTPGIHMLSVRVDNSAQVGLGKWSHAWSEEVQTIWNGIIGRIELHATEKVYVKRARIFPDIRNRRAVVKADIVNLTKDSWTGTLILAAGLQGESRNLKADTTFEIEGSSHSVEAVIAFGDDMVLWDEFDPRIYEMTVSLTASRTGSKDVISTMHTLEETFGMREFGADGPRFKMNDNYVLLRGTHDAGNFPLTGYPSMNKEDWLRIYRIGKSYGLNHFRFHSWCPPEAAFAAADEVGVILQAELPLFGLGSPPLGKNQERDEFLERELYRILESYGNHPSFCMMCMGNELSGDYRILNRFAIEGKKKDPRRLYSTAANNAAEPSMGIKPALGDDFYVAHEARVNGERHARRGELTFNRSAPETVGDYAYTLASIEIPTVSHEVGQWAVYPNYREIEKYTGVLEPRNLIKFRQSLEANGMLEEAETFLRASGALSVRLYREEIERSLRTPNYGGFQLLDIHDFPGQGTSLVGWLDAFWDSKEFIEPERFRRFCDAIVLLLRLPKRVYRNNEELEASIDIANYGSCALSGPGAEWTIRDSSGRMIGSGSSAAIACGQGEVATIGWIRCPLNRVGEPEKLTVEVSIPGTSIANDWDVWVYPAVKNEADAADRIRIESVWSEELESYLTEGGNVLFLATSSNRSEAASFTSPFWNTQLFPNQPKTMGLTCDPGHPAFAGFPNDGHTDWQWWDLFIGARAIDLNDTPAMLHPLAKAIDHPLRNRKLGLLFECAVGRGKLVVSGFDLLSDLDERPAASQLLRSVLGYMNGDRFRPSVAMETTDLRDRLQRAAANRLSQIAKSVQASSKEWYSKVEHLIDCNLETFWISQKNGYPHEIVIELNESTTITGFKYVPLQDGSEKGWVADYEWYASMDGSDWGSPVAKGTFKRHAGEQRVELEWVSDGFNTTKSKTAAYVRFVALSGWGGDEAASAAEIDIMTE